MAGDGIFEDDELEAANATAGEDEGEPQKDEQPCDENGKFASKDTVDDPEPGNDADLDEDDDKPKDDKTVPHGALHAERQKRKGLEKELADARGKLEALAKLREEAQARKAEPLPAADDPNAIEVMRARLEALEAGQGSLTSHFNEQALAMAEAQQLGSVMQQSEAAFVEANPDYYEAVNHVVLARANELKLYGLDQSSIQAVITEEASEIVRAAIQQGRDPAELAYSLAKARGYVAKAPDEGAPQGQSAIDKVKAIGAAQAASKSLGSAAGASTKELNAASIAAMSSEDFEALYATPEGRALIDNL